MNKKKIGIALGGGAARGFAHIGVLEILDKENIPVDMMAGTSAGAVVGALYAQGISAAQIKKMVLEMDGFKRFQLVDISLPKTGFLAGKKITELLKSFIGDVEFSDLDIPFACTATDIMTGEEIIINNGPVLDAVRASISVPIIFAAVKYKERFLVDGGLMDQVPVDVIKDMGPDITIGVNVTPRISNTRKRLYIDDVTPYKQQIEKEPNMYTIMMNYMSIVNTKAAEASLKRADIIIEPRLSGISFTDFRKAEQCILEGEFAGIDALLDIKKLLAEQS
jgi:NTE family protein